MVSLNKKNMGEENEVLPGIIHTFDMNGNPGYIKATDNSMSYAIRPLHWSPQQLRDIADYIESHPERKKRLSETNK